MTETIDLAAERNKREQPDPDFRATDGHGRPIYLFTCEYDYDGSTWGFDVWAYSMEDAQKRAAAIGGSVRCMGQIFSMRPA